MAYYAPITNWHWGEEKQFQASASDANEEGVEVPLDLSEAQLEWRVSRYAGADPIMVVTDFEAPVTPEGSSFPSVAVWRVHSGDYPENLRPGVVYHELWDVTHGFKLSYGPALLSTSTPAPVE